MNRFHENVRVVKCNNFGTAVGDGDYLPASGSFIDMSGYDSIVFLIAIGALDTATTFTVYQDTSATATAGIKTLTTSKAQTIGATDDNNYATIEVRADEMDRAGGYRYLTLKATGSAGGNDYFSVVALQFGANKLPVTQPTSYLYKV